MKVILDANIYISYLLSPEPHKTIPQVVEACVGKELELIVTEELLDDIREGVEDSKSLKAHISEQAVNDLITTLTSYTDSLPAIETTAYSRDVKDDYLLAQSIVHDVTYLVTGDEDLLTLGQVEGVKIITPAQFLHELEKKRRP